MLLKDLKFPLSLDVIFLFFLLFFFLYFHQFMCHLKIYFLLLIVLVNENITLKEYSVSFVRIKKISFKKFQLVFNETNPNLRKNYYALKNSHITFIGT